MNEPYDVIVVGSGAGGATVAREMALRGKRVLITEQGGRCNWMGNTLTLARVYKRFGLTRSREKYNVVFANNYGGASNIAAGCAFPPQKSVFDPVGIDLQTEGEEARRDLGIQTLPDHLVGEANLRLLQAAQEAGYHWKKMEKFVDASKCNGNGGCMLGCKTGAKWTARVFADQAVSKGADVRLHTHVTSPLVENQKVVGVEARHRGRKVKYYGRVVVLSAGMGNVDILRRAGIPEAGEGMCCDWLQFVGGIVPGINAHKNNSPMAVGTDEHYDTEGLVLSPVFPNWAMFAAILFFMGVRFLPKIANFQKYAGIMVKVRDQTAGRVHKGLSFSKPLTELDQMKLDKGVSIIKKVFAKAGASDKSILVLKPMGAHPSATCRIGEVVDRNLETRIGQLYCCDASVLPVALGTPVIWTLVALGKRLAKHLDGRLS